MRQTSCRCRSLKSRVATVVSLFGESVASSCSHRIALRLSPRLILSTGHIHIDSRDVAFPPLYVFPSSERDIC